MNDKQPKNKYTTSTIV